MRDHESFPEELSDIPQQIARLGHKHRTTAYGQHHPACLACGTTVGAISAKGFCDRCDYPIPPWRRWNVARQGQPPYYHPEHVTCPEARGSEEEP